jgi:peptide deformylase
MALELRFFPDTVLSTKCERVTELSEACLSRISQMKETLYSVPGVALAAPQVGLSYRIIILNMMKIQAKPEMFVLINPIINKIEGEIKLEEGCLSIPEIFEEITRPQKIEVTGMGLDGGEVFLEADDILARAIQHEIDHLDGVLFWDRLPGKKKKKLKDKYFKNWAQDKIYSEREPQITKDSSPIAFARFLSLQ